jgi:rubrerythrin
MIAALHVLGHTLMELDSSYQVVCSSCIFRKDLDDAELSSAEAAKRLYQQLEAHEIDPARYSAALDALDFPTLRNLRVEAATWLCADCNEKVPATINACWNCGSPRPGLQKPSSPDYG